MKHLLIAKYLLVNLIGALLVGVAYRYGYVDMVVAADVSGLSYLIGGVFLWAYGEGFYRAFKRDSGQPTTTANMQFASGVMVTLGLIGTVIGFIVALSGVNPDAIGNVNAIGPMVASLIKGMGIALYTTLVGAIGGLWTSLNCHLLRSADHV